MTAHEPARVPTGMQQARARRDKAARPPAPCDRPRARGDWSVLAEILWGIGLRLAAEREQSDERHGEEGTDRR